MNSRHRSGFLGKRPLPTISETPNSTSSTSQPGTVPKLSTRQPAQSSAAASLKQTAPIKPRTSKTSQKHVALPTDAQDAPLPTLLEPGRSEEQEHDDSDEQGDSDETTSRPRYRRGRENREGGSKIQESSVWKRTVGEQLTAEQRNEMGYQRLTAYYCCEQIHMGLLSSFLKREHAVSPRLYDDAIYALYHLPLLPGYQPNVNVRSCITDKAAQAKLVLSLITEAEESGYHDAYFPASVLGGVSTGSGSSTPVKRDGFIETAIPAAANLTSLLASNDLPDDGSLRRSHTLPKASLHGRSKRLFPKAHIAQRRLLGVEDHPVAEVIFFRYGVVVFFGFSQHNELDIIDDLIKRGILVAEKKVGEKKQYEMESFHFEYDPSAPTPRIYNDFFTFKSPSHLLKLAIAHAIAQSTVLSTHETASSNLLSSTDTLSIPLQLASSGVIKMKRRNALRLTGQLFQMRQNINLSSNVLDVPELFWSEASLKGLYDAVREYLEVDERVKALNAKLAGVGDLLDVIHDHLNNDAMERITIIIIWLIVIACLVEMGELLARWILAAAASSKLKAQIIANRQQVLAFLEEVGV
ncbi:hypothetical protein FRC14_002596 [Serendipita sp. 396]|nr:hypothetical protein FRC14_002596 [Serendipita sp. 396]KAG8788465.1 hypothetical protein FRC15_004129 [Serendipita sp. 397]KAG8803545.1 hypothetical protein FRC16_004671 [Serendipita sp. 398]KAG8874674.1 hypothetical protein FRC20_005449 [Serendipita sp. 405]